MRETIATILFILAFAFSYALLRKLTSNETVSTVFVLRCLLMIFVCVLGLIGTINNHSK